MIETFGLTAESLQRGDQPARLALEHVLGLIHEGAHTAYAHAIGGTVTSSRITQEAGDGSHTGATSAELHHPARDWVLFALSGQAAEAAWLTKAGPALDLDPGLARHRLRQGCYQPDADQMRVTGFTDVDDALQTALGWATSHWSAVRAGMRRVETGCDCLARLAGPRTAIPQAPQQPSAAVTNNTGGTAMSGIDEVKAAIAHSAQRGTGIAGALQQVITDIEESRSQLAGAFNGADQQEAHEALGALTRALERAEETRSLVQISSNAAEGYGARL